MSSDSPDAAAPRPTPTVDPLDALAALAAVNRSHTISEARRNKQIKNAIESWQAERRLSKEARTRLTLALTRVKMEGELQAMTQTLHLFRLLFPKAKGQMRSQAELAFLGFVHDNIFDLVARVQALTAAETPPLTPSAPPGNA